jgi:hypothetical protein
MSVTNMMKLESLQGFGIIMGHAKMTATLVNMCQDFKSIYFCGERYYLWTITFDLEIGVPPLKTL